ncbi:MAG: hypothetical protein HYX65_12435 [Gemmatimonadetes bacterium]|nr:hypothetical protein [Gemmatimonadota bacterium]
MPTCADTQPTLRQRRMRAAAMAAIAMLLSLAPIATLRAQSCPSNDPDCAPNRPPKVSLRIASITLDSASAVLHFVAEDDFILSYSSIQFTVNGSSASPQYASDYRFGRRFSGNWNVSLPSSTNVVKLTACDQESLCGVDSLVITHTVPATSQSPFLFNGLRALQHTGYRPSAPCGGCVATLAYATPAYVSMDAPRSLAVSYSSATAAPMGYVQVAVMRTGTDSVKAWSIRIKHAGGYRTFKGAGGPTQLYFTGNARYEEKVLTGHFDLSSDSTGASLDTLEVRAHLYPSGEASTSDTIRVITVNERGSPLGRGVSWAGIPRLKATSDGVLLLPGDGSGWFYRQLTSSTFATPDGIFATLRMPDASTYELASADSSKVTFNSSGNPTSATDRFSNATTFSWDGYGRLSSVTDPASKVINVGYSGTGVASLRTITDAPGNRTSTFAFDDTLRLKSVTQPDSRVAFQDALYDAQHRLLSVKGPLGAVTTFTYGANSWVRSVAVAGPGGVQSSTTTVRPSLDTLAPPSGLGDSINHLWTPGPASTLVRSPDGASVTTMVDRFALPLLVETRAPSGQLQASWVGRDQHGHVISASSSGGLGMVAAYSGPRLMSVWNGQGTQRYFYGAYDQVDSVKLDTVLLMRAKYTGTLAKLDTVVQGTARTAYQVDSRGRVTWVKAPNNAVSTISYQSSGFLNTASTTTPLGTATLTYDGLGRVIKTVDPLSRADSAAYDVLNRVTWARDPAGQVTQFANDSGGFRFKTTDARSQVYQSLVDHFGRDTAVVDPAGAREKYIYDVAGNLQKYVNRRGDTTIFSFDSLGRMTRRIMPRGGSARDTTTYAYDPASAANADPTNTWIATKNGASVDTIFFDHDGRPANAKSTRSGTTLDVAWVYDPATGARKQVIWSRSGGQADTVNMKADGLLRLTRQSGPSGPATQVTYSLAGTLDSILYPVTSGIPLKVRHVFTDAGRLEGASTNEAGPLLNRAYTYDAQNRLTLRYLGGHDGGGAADWKARNYAYNSASRLSGFADSTHATQQQYQCETMPEGDQYCQLVWVDVNTEVRTASYTYDAVGNRTDRGAYTGAANRDTLVDGYRLTYDDDGNVLSKTKSGVLAQYYYWGALGQLDSVQTNGSMTAFKYDGWGRRVRKTTGAQTTHYVLDGDVMLAELDGGFARLRSYSYWPGTDRPHAMKTNGYQVYYHYDEPGSVIALTTGDGTTVSTYEYDPWGQTVGGVENWEQPFQFTAREFDRETGLYYYRARYYDPHRGRFLSEDPIGLVGGINLYAYVENDPANSTDPTGLETCPEGKRWIVFYPSHGTPVFECISFAPLEPITITERGPSPFERYPTIGPRGEPDPIAPNLMPPSPSDVDRVARALMSCSAQIVDAAIAVGEDALFFTEAVPAALALKVRRGAGAGVKLERVLDAWRKSYVASKIQPARAGMRGATQFVGGWSWRGISTALQATVPQATDLLASFIPGANSIYAIYKAGACVVNGPQ